MKKLVTKKCLKCMTDLSKPEFLEVCMRKYGFHDWDSLLAAVGRGGLREGQIVNKLLEEYEHESGIHERAVVEVFVFTVASGAMADRRAVRDVLWPAGARVKEVLRGAEHILPDGDTVLCRGDVVTVVCKTAEHEKVKEELAHIFG